MEDLSQTLPENPVDWEGHHVVEFYSKIGLSSETIDILKEFGIVGSTLLGLTEADLECDELEVDPAEVQKLLTAIAKLNNPEDEAPKQEYCMTSVCADSEGRSYFGEHRIALLPHDGPSPMAAVSALQGSRGAVFNSTCNRPPQNQDWCAGVPVSFSPRRRQPNWTGESSLTTLW